MFISKTKTLLFSGLLLLGACASEVHRYPTSLLPSEVNNNQVYVNKSAVTLRMDTGYSRTVSAGTEFKKIATIREGVVFKPVSTVLTVEGAHMHEAYLVVSDDVITGFYLPVEKSFSPLTRPTKLFFEKKGVSQ